MCIESKAWYEIEEVDGTLVLTGDYSVNGYATNTTGGGTGFVSWGHSDFFVYGHTYQFRGRVGCFVTKNSAGSCGCTVSFPSDNGNISIAGLGGGYTVVDFTFLYYGQDLGFIFDFSCINSTSGKLGSVLFSLSVDSNDPIVISDLGVLSTDSDILKQIDKSTQHTEKIMGEVNETSKGIFGAIKDFFGSFFQNLIDSVIGLFVPSTEEMGGLFDELNQFFSDTFGFLYAPFDYLFRLVGVFTSSTGSTGLTFPGFSIMGYEVWPDMTYDIANDPVAGKVLEYVRMGTGVLLAGWFIMYLQDFFKERFGSGE